MYMYVHTCTLWTFSTSVDEHLRLAGSDCINISVVVNCKIVVNRKILRITNMGHSMPNHLNFKIAPYVSWTPVGRILVPTSRSFLRYMYDPLKNHTLPPFPHSKLFWWPCLPFLRPTYISKMHINLKIIRRVNGIHFVSYACTPGVHVCVPNKDRPMSTLLGAMVGVWMWAHRNNGVWALFEHSVTSQLTNYGVWGPYHEKETGYGTFDNRNLQNGCHSPCYNFKPGMHLSDICLKKWKKNQRVIHGSQKWLGVGH